MRGSDVQRPRFGSIFVNTKSNKTVCGVLYKYVNIGKGWRPRYFVLKDSVLRYFKISHENLANVLHAYEHCKQVGPVEVIGEDSYKYEEEARANFKEEPLKALEDLEAKGVVHISVSKFRQSNADTRKFYIYSGTSTIQLRAETSSDRIAWLQALKIEKGHSDSQANTPRPNIKHGVENTQDLMNREIAALEGYLQGEGLDAKVISAIKESMKNLESKFIDQLTVQREKRQQLVEYITTLETDKQQLETAFLRENRNSIIRDEPASEGMQLLSATSDIYQPSMTGSIDIDDESDGDAEAESDSSIDDEDFYDCDWNSFTADEFEAASAVELNDATADFPMPEGLANEPVRHRRSELPEPVEKEKKISLWSVIKDMVGKDLTRICLPVYFNEPISALQKLCEDFEYVELLDKAAKAEPGSVQRMAAVCAFAVSGYGSTEGRTRKPFNPLLGETFEYTSPEKGFRFFSEKVVHHPTILAGFAEGRGWKWETAGELKSKFWGRLIELIPIGTFKITFCDGEVIKYNKVSTLVNNIIIGKMRIEHSGNMKFESSTGINAKVKFKETSMLDKMPHMLKGYIENKSKEKVAQFRGQWSSDLVIDSSGVEECLWKRNKYKMSKDGRHLPPFAKALNELFEDEKPSLCPTDTRLRPDQRFLELGMYDNANEEKLRVEQKQRAARKAAEKGAGIKSKWFTLAPNSNPKKWTYDSSFFYTDEYWQSRSTREFSRCADIFG